MHLQLQLAVQVLKMVVQELRHPFKFEGLHEHRGVLQRAHQVVVHLQLVLHVVLQLLDLESGVGQVPGQFLPSLLDLLDHPMFHSLVVVRVDQHHLRSQ